jgi:hypothetical protein
MAPVNGAASSAADSSSEREIEIMDRVLQNKPGEKRAVSSRERWRRFPVL